MKFKSDDEIKKWAEEHDLVFLIPDGYPEAFVGVYGWDEGARAVYDTEKIIQVLVERDGMSRAEAVEFFDFNIEGGNPESGPLFIRVP